MTDHRPAADAVRARIAAADASLLPPRVGLILGSGLGAFAERLTGSGAAIEIPFAEVPDLPPPTVGGHRGRLVAGRLDPEGPSVLCLDGRLHWYEGHEVGLVILPARLMAALGVETLIVTNAAGGVNRDFRPGDLMLIDDHINLSGVSPLRGPNDDDLGPRFPDMTEAYDAGLRARAVEVAKGVGLPLRRGVYTVLGGPAYETPAEIRAVATLGGDAVGMSTVFEVTAAVHAGVKVLGLSLITNAAAGLGEDKLSHQEVLEVAAAARDRTVDYLADLVRALGS